MLLLIDNYDSFTWNLVQAFLSLGMEVEVVRSDEGLPIGGLLGRSTRFSHVVVGPGPGRPSDLTVARESLEACRGRIPWLGVCLGHQVLAESLGAKVIPTGSPVHGKGDSIEHDGSGIFRGLPNPFVAARYHSLAIDSATLPAALQVVAWAGGRGETTGTIDPGLVPPRKAGGVGGDRTIMAIAVPGEATWGVQFHPESFMTPDGPVLLANWLDGVPGPIHTGSPALSDIGSKSEELDETPRS